MSSLVLGIGVGSFILVCIWIVAFILCLISIRTNKVIGFSSILTALLVTIILLLIPKSTNEENSSLEEKESDYNFIWHNLLATFFGLCSVGSLVLFFIEFVIEPVQTTRVRFLIDK